MIIATAKAIRPSNSAAAKPMNRRPCWLSAAAGFLSAPCRNEPKTLPTPAAAAPTPMAARPAPMTWADAKSMISSFVKIERGRRSVQVDRVVDVERGQQREHISLDGADQQLERADAGDEDEAQNGDERAQHPLGVEAADDEAAEDLHQDMAGDHRHEKPQRQA